MLCAIWYHLYNLRNKKSTHGVESNTPPVVLKVILLHGCFPRFLNYANGAKSRKVSHICRLNITTLLFKCIKPAEKIH